MGNGQTFNRSNEEFRQPQWIAALLFGALAGPVAWALHLNISYSAVPFLCGSTWQPILHVVTLLTIALAASGAFVAYRCWRASGSALRTEVAGSAGRTRLLALGGLALSISFVLIILVQSIPNYFFDPCLRDGPPWVQGE